MEARALAVPPEDLVSLTIDGVELSVPKGTLVIRAAEQLGIEIPRFCDHPSSTRPAPAASASSRSRASASPWPPATITCTDGMVVRTHLTSQVAEKAQVG